MHGDLTLYVIANNVGEQEEWISLLRQCESITPLITLLYHHMIFYLPQTAGKMVVFKISTILVCSTVESGVVVTIRAGTPMVVNLRFSGMSPPPPHLHRRSVLP